MAKLIRHGCTAALSAFGLIAFALMLALAAPAQAVPVAAAPVYAIGDYPYPKAPALMRWRSVQEREAQRMARANPEDCKDGEPRLACAVKEALLLEEKLQDKSPTEQVEGVYAYFNAVKYQEHGSDCGVDCWKTRLDFLADREGDCGDHALRVLPDVRIAGHDVDVIGDRDHGHPVVGGGIDEIDQPCLEPGADPHSFEPSLRDRERLKPSGGSA